MSFESAYGDAGSGLIGRGPGVIPPPLTSTSTTPGTAAVANPYYNKRGELALTSSGLFFQFSARGYVRSIEYQQSDQSNHEHYGQIQFAWIYSEAARINVYTDYLKRTFVDLVEEDTLRTSSVAFTSKLNRNIYIRLEGARYEESSNVPLNNFVDRRVMVILSYSTGSIYVPQPRR
jgi:hypothetical protein